MTAQLADFINQCNKQNITPSERHIDYFLTTVNRLDLRNSFIHFCFYNWENRIAMLNKLMQLENERD
jgi:hypothetical protein